MTLLGDVLSALEIYRIPPILVDPFRAMPGPSRRYGQGACGEERPAYTALILGTYVPADGRSSKALQTRTDLCLLPLPNSEAILL